MKIDFHIHSIHSPDSLNSMWLISKFCKMKGITPVICDHNRIDYAKNYKQKFGNAIVAEEIQTNIGEVVCLFATELIKPMLSIEETIEKIRDQGALVYVPHPFDAMRGSAIRELKFKPDIVEVFNARVIKKEYNRKALEFAESRKTLKATGSDAHLPFEIGRCYVEMEEFNSIKEFKKNLASGKLTMRYSNLIVHPISKSVYFLRKSIMNSNKLY